MHPMVIGITDCRQKLVHPSVGIPILLHGKTVSFPFCHFPVIREEIYFFPLETMLIYRARGWQNPHSAYCIILTNENKYYSNTRIEDKTNKK